MNRIRILDGEDGASELIGVVLMISLAIVGIAVISVMFFSGQNSVAIPKVETLVGEDSQSQKFYISHNGGDSLRAGEYKILVDSGSGYEDKTSEFILDGGGDTWSTGESLVYDYSGTGIKPESVNIVYTAEGQNTLLTSTPLLYGGEGGASVGTGDVGTGITYDDIEISTINPVNVEDPLDISGGLTFQSGGGNSGSNLIAGTVNESSGFVADVVHCVVYNYDRVMNEPNKNNAFVINMEKNTTIGSDAWSGDARLNTIVSGTDPVNITLTLVAYNTTSGQIFSNSGLYVATFT